jgi:hypothetical protein
MEGNESHTKSRGTTSSAQQQTRASFFGFFGGFLLIHPHPIQLSHQAIFAAATLSVSFYAKG